MANDSKRTSQLGIVTSLGANDRIIVLTNPDSSAQTQTIAVGNFGNCLPFANATNAGVVSIGPGISINSNGQISAPIPVANTTSPGVVTIGSNISVNGNGVISVGQTNTFSLGTSAISQNGYSYLPNGLKINWGTFVCNTTSSVIFTSPFGSTIVAINITPIGSTLTGSNTPYISASNTSVANIFSASASGANCYYSALGY